MSDLHIVAVLYAKGGRDAELRERLIEVVEPSRRDEGSLGYDLFVEHWASAEAQQHHHTQTGHIRRFQETGADAVERMELFSRLDRLV